MTKSSRETSLWANRKVLLCCILISSSIAQYGFDTATIGGLQAMPGFLEVFGYPNPKSPTGYSITTTVQQLIASLLTVGSVVGCLLTGPFSRKFGRKPALWTGCAIAFIANAVQLGSTNLAGLYCGRILLGISNAFYIVFATMFMSEITPHHLRAILISFFGWFVNFSTVLGNVVDYLTKGMLSKLAYRIPLACNFFFPTVLFCVLFFVRESPRWLILQGRQEEARKSLIWYRGKSLPQEALEEELVEMERGIAEEIELAKGVTLMDLFRGNNLRRTMICVAALASHAATGVFVIISFNTFFFQQAGLTNAFQLSITSSVMGWLGANVGMYLMYKVLGRRSMMVGGAFCCGIFMLALAIAWTIAPTGQASGKALTAFAMLYNFSYNAGIGSVSYAVANEAVSSRLRAYSMGLGTGTNYVFNWLVTFTAPYFINATSSTYIGVKYCYVWAASNFITMTVLFFIIPEMKGLTLEEIDECFENGVKTRKFKQYQPLSALRAAEAVQGEKVGTTVEVQENANA